MNWFDSAGAANAPAATARANWGSRPHFSQWTYSTFELADQTIEMIVKRCAEMKEGGA